MIWLFGSLYIVIGVITVVLILLHSGRGGGLSDMFGGGLSGAAAGSTSMERNLDRLTIIFGLAFTFLTIGMAFLIQTT